MQSFFNCLLDRIHYHSRKKIQPVTTSIPNLDPSLTSKLTRHAWHLHNVAHVKMVFHTPFITLQTTRSFLINSNGTYRSYQPPVIELQQQQLSNSNAAITANNSPSINISSCGGSGSSNGVGGCRSSTTTTTTGGASQQPALIKPQEYRTVMRIGQSAYHPTLKQTPFTIEWTPDVFPISKIGELRIKFEFDHIHNGQLVKNIAFKEVIATIPGGGSIPLLQNPIIIASNNNISTITTSANVGNIINSVSSKAMTPIKPAPALIAPKLTFLSQLQDHTSLDDVTATALDISLPHETFVDTEGYTTLLF